MSEMLEHMHKILADLRQRDPLKDIPKEYVAALHPATHHALERYIIDNKIEPNIYTADPVGSFLRRKLFVSALVSRDIIEYLPYGLALAKYSQYKSANKESLLKKIKHIFISLWFWLRNTDFTADNWREQSEQMWRLAFLHFAEFPDVSIVDYNPLPQIAEVYGIPREHFRLTESSNRSALETVLFHPRYTLHNRVNSVGTVFPPLTGG